MQPYTQKQLKFALTTLTMTVMERTHNARIAMKMICFHAFQKKKITFTLTILSAARMEYMASAHLIMRK